jgi:hypothetical protein
VFRKPVLKRLPENREAEKKRDKILVALQGNDSAVVKKE